jgi:hypothetical protein
MAVTKGVSKDDPAEGEGRLFTPMSTLGHGLGRVSTYLSSTEVKGRSIQMWYCFLLLMLLLLFVGDDAKPVGTPCRSIAVAPIFSMYIAATTCAPYETKVVTDHTTVSKHNLWAAVAKTVPQGFVVPDDDDDDDGSTLTVPVLPLGI